MIRAALGMAAILLVAVVLAMSLAHGRGDVTVGATVLLLAVSYWLRAWSRRRLLYRSSRTTIDQLRGRTSRH